jgi:AraC-like DNA-binding protein
MIKTPPLSRFPYFRTTDVDQAREALARVYGDGRLTPVGSGKSFLQQFNVAPLGRITITAMEWGCGMTFDAPSLDGCFDFSSIVQGHAKVRVGREVVETDAHRSVVMSPSESLHIRWDQRLVSLNAKVERRTLESHLAAIAGIDVKQRLEFSPAMLITGPSATVVRLVRHMANEVNQDASLLDFPLVAESFSETLLTTVLFAQPNNYSESLTRKPPSAEPNYVRRAEEYLEAHCDQPVTAELLASVVGVSLGTLYAAFRKHRDYTPIGFLRLVRLRRVRAALLTASPDSTVNQVALKWGFNHLGRFASLYREHFGESPSETLGRRL